MIANGHDVNRVIDALLNGTYNDAKPPYGAMIKKFETFKKKDKRMIAKGVYSTVSTNKKSKALNHIQLFNPTELCAWMHILGLQFYERKIIEQGIDSHILVALNCEQLKRGLGFGQHSTQLHDSSLMNSAALSMPHSSARRIFDSQKLNHNQESALDSGSESSRHEIEAASVAMSSNGSNSSNNCECISIGNAHLLSLICAIVDLRLGVIDNYDCWKWSQRYINYYLQERGLDELIPLFAKYAIHGGVLFRLSKEDFMSIYHFDSILSSPLLLSSLFLSIERTKEVGWMPPPTVAFASSGDTFAGPIYNNNNIIHDNQTPHRDTRSDSLPAIEASDRPNQHGEISPPPAVTATSPPDVDQASLDNLEQEFPKDARDWNMEYIEQWLKVIHLGHLFPLFRKHGVNGALLLHLKKADFEEILGVSEIQSLVINKHLQKLKSKQEKYLRKQRSYLAGCCSHSNEITDPSQKSLSGPKSFSNGFKLQCQNTKSRRSVNLTSSEPLSSSSAIQLQ